MVAIELLCVLIMIDVATALIITHERVGSIIVDVVTVVVVAELRHPLLLVGVEEVIKRLRCLGLIRLLLFLVFLYHYIVFGSPSV